MLLNNKKKSKIFGCKLITHDEILVKLLVDVMNKEEKFKNNLHSIILRSKEETDSNSNVCVASANAITLLVAGNSSFSNKDLAKIRIPGAIVRDGMFCDTNFTEADLTGVDLENCKLNGALFNRTLLKGLRLGMPQDINVGYNVNSVAFSRDGKHVVCASWDRSIKLWNIGKNSIVRIYRRHLESVTCVAFSEDGEYILIQ